MNRHHKNEKLPYVLNYIIYTYIINNKFQMWVTVFIINEIDLLLAKFNITYIKIN